mgnify:CR=1 FL=1
MNENKKKMYDLSGPKTVEAMKKRHFDAYYCSCLLYTSPSPRDCS